MGNAPVKYLGFSRRTALRRGALFGAILLVALLAFEIFNYSTTDFALTDLLGRDLRFLGIRWATILSIAFCGIDFAGIARLFTPEQGRDEPAEVWYLFGAWLLAAAVNAMLTWWGVAVAVRNPQALANTLLSQSTLLNVVPVIVAVMVWFIRVLVIGTFSIAGERLFSMAEDQPSMLTAALRTLTSDQITTSSRPSYGDRSRSTPVRPTPRPEPTYHPVGLSARPRNPGSSLRN